MTIEIAWEAGGPPPDLDEVELRRVVGAFLSAIDREGWGISLLFASDDTLHALNRDHRGRDTPTDVLSWPYDPCGGGQAGMDSGEAEGFLLGDLALSLERAQVQAGENGWPRGVEVARLLAHGCAHLVGYDHQTPEEERQMLAVEEHMLAAAGVEPIYPRSLSTPDL